MAQGDERRATLRDVARAAGVHPATASRALNERTRKLVKEETARRVLEAARALSYRPNPIAKGLRTRRSATVGVLIPDLTNPLFPPIIRGVEEVLEPAGYAVAVANCDYDLERERGHYREMLARQVEGFVVATALRRHPLLEETGGRPYVLVNRTVDDEGVAAAILDDEAGIGMVVDHLAALGHRAIAHLAGPQQTSTGHRRLQGFLRAREAHGLPPDPELVVVTERMTEGAAFAAVKGLLERRPDVTAVVASNDLMAVGCYAALERLGLRCPEDVSVAGFNDLRFMDRLCPPLTTVRVPHRILGNVAGRLLLERLRDPEAAQRTVRLTPSLVVRGSTAPPRGARDARRAGKRAGRQS